MNQKSAKILREALAHIAKFGDPNSKSKALTALGKYAKAIVEVCEHTDLASVKAATGQTVKACLDCGKRFL